MAAETNTAGAKPPLTTAQRREQLRHMKIMAGMLLIIMLLVLAISIMMRTIYPWMSWVSAFTEAALVGGIADWFAVTALFKHPLGLPIPHTAIIPANKASIARNLGVFVQDNFLTEDSLRAKMRDMNLDRVLQDYLKDETLPDKITDTVLAKMPEFLGGVNLEAIAGYAVERIKDNINGQTLAETARDAVMKATEGEFYIQATNLVLRSAADIIGTNQDFIKQKINESSPWYIPGFLERDLFNRILELRNQLLTIEANRNHPIRREIAVALKRYMNAYAASPDKHRKLEDQLKNMLADPRVKEALTSYMGRLEGQMLADLNDPDSKTRATVRSIVAEALRLLAEYPMVRQKLIFTAENALIDVLHQNSHMLADMISSTINRWDEAEIVDKLETQVGRDLQYIRINGTLVGGALGLLVHAVERLFNLY